MKRHPKILITSALKRILNACTFLGTIFILTSNNLWAQEQGDLIIDNYLISSFNNSMTNWSAVQDKQGLMYFASEFGIQQYDGTNWKLIPLPSKVHTRSIDVDTKGTVYVGAFGEIGYLQADSIGRLKYISLITKDIEAYVKNKYAWFTRCINNDVYFSIDSSLLRYKDGEFKVWKTKSRFNDIIKYKNRVFVFERNIGIREITEDSLQDIPSGDFFKTRYFWKYASLEDNKILIPIDNQGIYIYDFEAAFTNNGNAIIKKLNTQIDSLLLKYRPYACTALKNGNIAIGLVSAGVVIINTKGDLVNHITKKNGLISNSLTYLYEDAETNLWITTIEGISKTNTSSPLTYWGKTYGADGFTNDIIKFNNDIYLCRYSGIFKIHKGEFRKIGDVETPVFTFLDFKNPIEPYNHKLLAGTNLNDLIEIKNDKTIKIIPNLYSIFSLLQSRTNPSIIYIGQVDGVRVAEFKNNEWSLIGKIEGFDNQARKLFEDLNGNIWISNLSNELIKITPSENILKPKNIKTYLPGNKTNNIIKISEFNNELIFGNNKGLLKYDLSTDKVAYNNELNKIFNNDSIIILELINDKDGRLWISGEYKSNFGIAVYDKSNGFKWIETPFNILPIMQFSKSYFESDSTIWISGTEGVFRYKGNFQNHLTDYRTIFREITINNDSTIYFGNKKNPKDAVEGINNNTTIKHKYNSLIFKYSAISYYAENRTKYQIYLEGFDKGWSDCSLETKKEYTNLPEGDYIMRVRAKNVYDVISSEATYSFTILPPWHRTLMAYILYLIGLALFIWLIVFLNAKRLKAINEELEETIAERTMDLHELNTQLEEKQVDLEVKQEEILAQRDSIEQQNKELEKHRNNLDHLVQERTAELEKAKLKAEESDRLKSAFLANMSHEIRTPMNAIMGFSDLITDPEVEQELKEDLSLRITQNCESLLKLIDDIIDTAKIESGQLIIEKSEFGISDLMTELKSNFKSKKDTLNKTHIELKLNLPEPEKARTFYSDKEHIKQVLTNLLDNALKFTEEGFIEFGCLAENSNLKFYVKDSGIGLSEDQQETIFQRFTKVEEDRKKLYRGAGLGLSICKNIIELLGGKIGVESTINKGSKFYFTIPLK